jgi:uncharacterized metal-binding protein YceD (DUF177 family)
MEKKFIIPFVGLKEGKHRFDFVVNDKFFEFYKYDEILDANINVGLDFVKKSTLFELHFSAKGDIKVACDVTNEHYKEPIDTTLDLVIKFGNEFNNENEEILIIPHSEFQLDVAQFIYEMIVLAVPRKKVHPGVADGTLKSEILDKLKELQPKENTINQDTDPRWSKLKDLLTDKKE